MSKAARAINVLTAFNFRQEVNEAVCFFQAQVRRTNSSSVSTRTDWQFIASSKLAIAIPVRRPFTSGLALQIGVFERHAERCRSEGLHKSFKSLPCARR